MSSTETPVPVAGEMNETSATKEEPPKEQPATPPQPPAPTADAAKVPSFQERFKAFSKFGDTKSDGKHLTLSQSDKWMKQAGVIDGKKITTTDTGIYFKKFKQQKIGYSDYGKFLEELARVKKVEVTEMKTKMRSCGEPGLKGTTAVVKNSSVTRLSDTPKKKEENGKAKASPRSVKSPVT